MSVVTQRPSTDRVIIRDVSWETYETLLRDLENRSSPRIAFDQGVLEIMSPHLEHERANKALATIVESALEELHLEFENAGSTTFKKEGLQRGFEPDSCFYIANVERIRNKNRIDMEIDPPPDLVIEVDLTRDSLDKFPLYAALGIPEIWRYEDTLEIWILDQGRYFQRQTSTAVPILTEKFVSGLLESIPAMKRLAWAPPRSQGHPRARGTLNCANKWGVRRYRLPEPSSWLWLPGSKDVPSRDQFCQGIVGDARYPSLGVMLPAGETVVRALAGFTRSSARAAYFRVWPGEKIKKQLER